MSLYFKEFDPSDKMFMLDGPPTFCYLDDWEVIDDAKNAMLLATNVCEYTLKAYTTLKASGELQAIPQPGSGKCVAASFNTMIPGRTSHEIDPSTLSMMRWFDIVPPIGMLRFEDDSTGAVSFNVYFKWPENSESDVLVGPIGGKLVPVKRDEDSKGIGRYNWGDFDLSSFTQPRRPKPRPWKTSDVEIAEAEKGPGPCVMDAEFVETLKAELLMKKGGPVSQVDDGSLVRIGSDGRLWSSSTASPKTYHWVPVLRHTPYAAGDKFEDWKTHLIGA